MYWKIEQKNTTIAFGILYEKQQCARLFVFKWYYKKKATQIGTLTTTRNLTIGLQYKNRRIKMFTHQHQTIKERIT